LHEARITGILVSVVIATDDGPHGYQERDTKNTTKPMVKPSEEISMFPYQIYQALMDEHVHELHAAARRHERAADARRAAANRREGPSRFKDAIGRLVALAQVNRTADLRHAAHSRPANNGSTAGPMGCVV
jgi:hypothetical protein